MHITKQLIEVPIEQLKHFGGNPRHNNKSAKVVAKSIKQYGYINPIVVDENLTILAGNTRFKAIKLLGWESVEVLKVEGLTEAQKNGFVIADNRVGEFSTWNYSAVERMLNNSGLDKEALKEFGMLSAEDTKAELEALIGKDLLKK